MPRCTEEDRIIKITSASDKRNNMPGPNSNTHISTNKIKRKTSSVTILNYAELHYSTGFQELDHAIFALIFFIAKTLKKKL